MRHMYTTPQQQGAGKMSRTVGGVLHCFVEVIHVELPDEALEVGVLEVARQHRRRKLWHLGCTDVCWLVCVWAGGGGR